MRFFSEPTLLVAFIEVIIGVFLLARAADEFVDGAARVASRASVSPVLVGAVVVGFGTSAPELLVSTLAAIGGDVDLGVGNIVGSNVANLSLVLGAAALMVPVLVTRAVLVREAPLSLLAVLLLAFLAYIDGLSRLDGIILGIVLVGALSWIIAGGRVAAPAPVPVSAGPPATTPTPGGPTTSTAPGGPDATPRPEDGSAHPTDGEEDSHEEGSLTVEALRTLLGLVGTVVGAQLLVWGAMAIAGELNMTGGFVGFTLVAVGTSLPELMTAIAAARRGATDLLLGNLLGSNIFNSLAVGSAIALVGPGPIVDEGLRTIGLLVMVLVACGAWVAMVTLRRVHRIEGAALLVAWLIAVVLLARTGTEATLGAVPQP
ncbi:MAG: calcium/sodium antiporter [Actinomycetota bacterium]